MSLLDRFLTDERREQLRAAWATARLDYTMASRNILRQFRRSAFGLVAVATGVIALVLASGFFEWNFVGMREGIIRAQIGHVVVAKKGFLKDGTADPFAYLIPDTSEDRSLLEAAPNVVTVAPRLSMTGLISAGDSTVAFIGDGIDPAREKELSGGLTIVKGVGLSNADGNEVIVGQGLAENLGVDVGQTVVLLCSTGKSGINAVEVKIAGLFRSVSKAYDDFALRLPVKTAQRLLKVNGVHSWLVLLDDTDRTDRFTSKLAPKMKSTDLELVPWHETPAADFYSKTVTLFTRQVNVLTFMIAIIIVLSISNTLMNNVRERIGEIGTCMALGDSRRTVLRRFLAEGTLIGVFGAVAGVVLAIVLAQIISKIGIPLPPPPGMTTGIRAAIFVTAWIVVKAVLLATLTAFFAGLYPAWRASRMPIVDALRHAR
ncbi:MAG: ABC transporter permease [Betaproteobacteria bacterium]|nr:ABC transporter permease [Betaproteobacteria bacterium]